MKLTSVDRLILSGLLLATIANLFSASLSGKLEQIQPVLYALVLCLIAVWLIEFFGRRLIHILRLPRFAASAFILNANKDLLLYFHPRLNRYVQMGGRIGLWEQPHDGAMRTACERTGLSASDLAFHEVFHPNMNPTDRALGKVERIASPFIVQREFTPQRGFVQYHYDFMYVFRVRHDDTRFNNDSYKPIRFVNLSVLRELVAKQEALPDVLDAYERILQVLNREC